MAKVSVTDPSNNALLYGCHCPRRDLAQKVKSRGGILVLYIFYMRELSMPDKISICLIRGCKESLDNDDVSAVHARK